MNERKKEVIDFKAFRRMLEMEPLESVYDRIAPLWEFPEEIELLIKDLAGITASSNINLTSLAEPLAFRAMETYLKYWGGDKKVCPKCGLPNGGPMVKCPHCGRYDIIERRSGEERRGSHPWDQNECCKNCRFDGGQKCKRHAPTRGKDGYYVYPVIVETGLHWCGDFEFPNRRKPPARRKC